MASFKEKMKDKKILGNKIINSDEALGLVFKPDKNTKIVDIEVDALINNPFQPRTKMDEEELQNLAGSIMHNGLLQPVLISQVPGRKDRFHIVAGHRRVAAVKFLGNKTIKAIVVEPNEKDMQINALIENIHRSNLTVLEEAFALKKLAQTVENQNDLCDIVLKSEDKISKLIKLTTISEDAFKYINDNDIQLGLTVLLEIIKLDNNKQIEAIKYITD
jgi:ParB family chromosome partitioning protein